MIAIGTVAVDLVSKAAAGAWLEDGPVRLGAGVSLRLVHNPGVAFGLGARLPSWVLLAVTGMVVSWLARAAWRGDLSPTVAAGLVLGGAVANLGDRATGATVVDMFDVGWWPTFNVADICITVGVVLMVAAAARPSVTGPVPGPLPGDAG